MNMWKEPKDRPGKGVISYLWDLITPATTTLKPINATTHS